MLSAVVASTVCYLTMYSFFPSMKNIMQMVMLLFYTSSLLLLREIPSAISSAVTHGERESSQKLFPLAKNTIALLVTAESEVLCAICCTKG